MNKRIKFFKPLIGVGFTLVLFVGFGMADKTSGMQSSLPSVDDYLRAEYWEYVNIGPVPVPVMNPMTDEKAELGKKLFFDNRLSGNNQLSCMSCHNPDKGWTDGRKVAIGTDNQKGTRNTPTIINAAYYKELFLDGRVESLEEQALEPIKNPIEMNQDIHELVKELKEAPEYVQLFNKAFDEDISAENIAKALASFERTIIQRNTPFDRYMAGDNDALTEQQKWGMQLFADEGNCMTCHAGPTFTDNDYDNIGIESGDLGRFLETAIQEDKGKFRTTQLRDLKYTAPYLHDGSLETLEDVVELYDKGEHPNVFVSVDIQPLHLTEDEKAALVAFIKDGLSGPTIKVEPPVIP